MFNLIAILIAVPLTQKIIYPLYEKYAGKRTSQYGKVFAGFIVVTSPCSGLERTKSSAATPPP